MKRPTKSQGNPRRVCQICGKPKARVIVGRVNVQGKYLPVFAHKRCIS